MRTSLLKCAFYILGTLAILLGSAFDLIVNNSALAATAATTTRISFAYDGSQVDGNTAPLANAMSDNAQYILLSSIAKNLVPGNPTNGAQSIYLLDRGANQNTLVAKCGRSGSISGDGQLIAILPGDCGIFKGFLEIQLYDVSSGTSTPIEPTIDGNAPNGDSGGVHISDNGKFVVFNSSASNLVTDDTNGQQDVFLRDLTSNTTSLISYSNGQQGNGSSITPAISPDGQYIAFSSSSSNLVPNDTNGKSDCFLKDMQTGDVDRVNLGPNDTEANGSCGVYSVSSGGRYVLFSSAATNLVPGVSDGLTHTYLRDRLLDTTELEDPGTIGFGSLGASMSQDARYIAFTSAANTLVPNDRNSVPDVFVRDRLLGTIERATVATDGTEQNNSGASSAGVISPDGRYVVFGSISNNIVPGDTNVVVDAFLRDRGTTDTTPPIITGSISPAPNGNGWNNSDVTVSFNCSDADSGIASCTSPVTLTNEGLNQSITGTATDNAGNTATTTITVNIDKTAPTISYTVTPSPNINSWNQDGVTVNFNCNDALSGIDSCTSPASISNEGANQTVTGTAVDKAGNTATVTATINVDKTAPAINYTTLPAPNANGWNNSDVMVSFTCNDALSGIDTCSNPSTVNTEGANQTVTGTAMDKAGNTANATATVNIDKTAPTIVADVSPASNGNGWNSSAVTVSFTCNDSLSGIATCPNPITLSSEGGGQIITGTAMDNAGNSASTSVMVNIDKTAPTVSALSWTANPLQQGQNTMLMATVSDSLSGVSGVSYSINGGTPQPMSYDPISGNWIITFGSSLPANTYNITVYATDAAGNTSSGTNDILAVYTTANGYVTGHAKVLPTPSDTLPIALDTSKNPADLVMGFTNVTAPMSGSFDLDYSIKNKQNEFSLSSTSIDWVVVSDSSHASILGQADMTTWVNGVETVTQNVSVRYDIVLGTNGSPDQVTVKIFNPGVNPNTGSPDYVINDQDEQSSNLMIHP